MEAIIHLYFFKIIIELKKFSMIQNKINNNQDFKTNEPSK